MHTHIWALLVVSIICCLQTRDPEKLLRFYTRARRHQISDIMWETTSSFLHPCSIQGHCSWILLTHAGVVESRDPNTDLIQKLHSDIPRDNVTGTPWSSWSWHVKFAIKRPLLHYKTGPLPTTGVESARCFVFHTPLSLRPLSGIQIPFQGFQPLKPLYQYQTVRKQYQPVSGAGSRGFFPRLHLCHMLRKHWGGGVM